MTTQAHTRTAYFNGRFVLETEALIPYRDRSFNRGDGCFDMTRTFEIMELLTSLNRDQSITIVMVTHEPDMAAFAKRIVHFKDGLIENDHAKKEATV